MDFAAYEAMVRGALESARDSLGRIEMTVREEGERADLMEASRGYAQFCMHVREYLSGVHMRKPMPRRFAQKIAPLRSTLETHAAALKQYDLRPSAAELDELVKAAQELPGTL